MADKIFTRLNREKFNRDFNVDVSTAARATGHSESSVLNYLRGYIYSELFFRRLAEQLNMPFPDFREKYLIEKGGTKRCQE